MNKYLIAMMMVVLVGLGYSQRGEAAACVATTYDNYGNPGAIANNFSCDIGDKTFSNFSYTSTCTGPGCTVIASSAIVVAPNFTGVGNQWGFTFSAIPLTANAGQIRDITLGYQVTCNGNGGPTVCLTSATLGEGGGVLVGTGGSATVGEDICLNSTIALPCIPNTNGRHLQTAFPTPTSATTSFAAVHNLTLIKDMNANCAAVGCITAGFSVVTNTVDQVPEPATLALLGAGLFSLAALRRRKISR